MGNGKGLLVGGILALLAVAFTAIGLSISHAISEADQAEARVERHCTDPDAHPRIQGKMDLVNYRLTNVESGVKTNSQKLDEIKKLIKQVTP